MASVINKLVRVKNNYTSLRGRIALDPIVEAPEGDKHTGRIPFGNGQMSYTSSAETQKHYSSEEGQAEVDDSFPGKIDRTGTLTTDNMSDENLAMFLSGTVADVSQAQISVAAEETITVIPGRYYQLGLSESRPTGLRQVSDVVVTNTLGGTTYDEDDYRVDLELGILQILSTGSIQAGDIKVEYKAVAASWSQIKTGDGVGLMFGVHLVAHNPRGRNIDWWFPKVLLSPNGELPLVQEGETMEYAKAGFSIEIMKPANLEAVYVDGRPRSNT